MLWISVVVAAVGCIAASTIHPKDPPPPPTSKCYQCAYSKADTLIETIKVPKIVVEDIEVPRVVIEDVVFTKIIHVPETFTKAVVEHIQVPHVVTFAIQKPKVIHSFDTVSKIVTEHAVTKLVFVQVPKTKLEFETVVKTKTILVHETITKAVEDIRQVPKVVTDVKQVSKIVIDIKQITKTEFDFKNITKSTPGGWDKCMGPFTHEEAQVLGVDMWDCPGNCYTRIDGDNMYRGCHRGEFGVDPNLFGCNEQAGAIWCICEGNLCNNGGKPNGAADGH